MTECEFSVIKYVPDIVRFEPVNIGISLLDKQNKKIHNKYMANFDEFFKRLGVEKIHGLERSFENYKPVLQVESIDYLWQLHDSFHGSIFYSEPIKVNTKEIDITLQQVFDKMISVPDKKQILEEFISVTKIRTKLKQHIQKLKFPEKTCEEKFEIDTISGIPQIRDFAFMNDDELVNTIDIFNFSESSLFESFKLFLYEMKALIESEKYKRNKPLIFSTIKLTENELSNTAKQSIEYINMNKIPIIHPEFQEEKIQEIRSSIG